MLNRFCRYFVGYNFPYKEGFWVPTKPEADEIETEMLGHLVDKDIDKSFIYAFNEL